jgi:hypothetical protein
MLMERIEVPVEAKAKPKPTALKLVAGALFLIVSALVMGPWLALVALWVAVTASFRAVARLGRLGYETLCYAGELVVGR